MHFSVLSGNGACAIEYHRRIVVQACRTTFEQGRNDDQAKFLGEAAQAFGARARNGFRSIELADVFVLAEVRPVVQFLQQDQAGASAGGRAQAGLDRIEVRFATAAVGFLQQSDLEGF
jgi:hypothetical protein